MQIKKLFISLIILTSCYTITTCSAGVWLGNMTSIYNQSGGNALNTNYNWANMSWPLNDWAYRIVNWDGWEQHVSWLVWTDQEITEYSDALSKIVRLIQNIVNYALWLLWVISVVYLLIHGFMVLTAGWNDEKTKKWLKWIKRAFIAIAWIALSWIIIRFILRIITFATS